MPQAELGGVVVKTHKKGWNRCAIASDSYVSLHEVLFTIPSRSSSSLQDHPQSSFSKPPRSSSSPAWRSQFLLP